MKDPFDRTKVVLRHLPPSLTQSALMEQIDARFSGRYNWFAFHPGKNSYKHQKHARAYIDFKKPEDVVEFAEFFNGHVFVNEKGTQFKAIVEYAPSQRVPKSWTKKDGREGTILKDPEYLEFLEFISKPIENLPSAEIQLEKREAERAGAPKEALIVTPLMDFVRQKRAAKSGSQRSNGKLSRRSMGVPSGNSRASTKRGSEKRRSSTSMYVLRDSAKISNSKEKSTYMLVPKRDDQDKSISVTAASGAEIGADDSGASGSVDLGKKKVVLLKGKDRDITYSSTNAPQQSVISPVRNSVGSPTFRHSQRREPSGKIIRSILLNKEARQNQSSTAGQSEQQIQAFNLEKDKCLPRTTNVLSVSKDNLSSMSQVASGSDVDSQRLIDVIGSDQHGFGSVNDKHEKHTRNKDRPDRGVWTLRRSDGSHASDEALSLSDSFDAMSVTHHLSATGTTKPGENMVDDTEFTTKPYSSVGRYRNVSSSYLEMKPDIHNSNRSGEIRNPGGIRSNFSVDNGSHRHISRRGPAYGMKDVDGSLSVSDMKPSKRGAGYGSHEKQVWVQKSGSGS